MHLPFPKLDYTQNSGVFIRLGKPKQALSDLLQEMVNEMLKRWAIPLHPRPRPRHAPNASNACNTHNP